MTGRVHLAAFTSDYMHLFTLAEDGRSWRNLTSMHYIAPENWSLGSVAVLPTSAGGWTVYGTTSTGLSTRSHRLGSAHIGWRDPTYEPYAGDGIYRFDMSLVSVVAFDVDRSGVCSGYRQITPIDWTGGLLGLSVAATRVGGRYSLVVGSHSGILYTIDLNILNTPPHVPEPVVDNSSGVLFMSRVIGGLVIAYPSVQGDETDDIILGGEASLHFSTAAELGLMAGALQLRHLGPVLEEGALLSTGQTPTVHVADWNNDGVRDIIAGSSEGRIFVALGNSDGTGFLLPHPVRIANAYGAPSELLVQGGYRHDIQGPSESRWGYTAAQAVDWNNDGLLDLLTSDNSAATSIYLRYKTGDGTLALRPGVALRLDGLELHGTWRNGPAAAHIGGSMVLVTSDEQDEMHMYRRVDDFNLADAGKLVVRSPTNASALMPIQTNYLGAGGTGRLKYAFVDWDQDGHLDLMLGTCGYHSIPSNRTGLPACSPPNASWGEGGECRNNGATVLLMRQAKNQPAQSGLLFEWPEWVTVAGRRISYGGQELGVSTYGDNISQGIVVATPGGRHVYWAAKDLGLSASEPPM